MRERERETERERERERETETDREIKNCQTKGNKCPKRYLTYIRGRQKHPISQEKIKTNFVFSDHFHQIIYIIPAPSTPTSRPLLPAPRPLYPRPPPPLPPYLPRPPAHVWLEKCSTWSCLNTKLFYLKSLFFLQMILCARWFGWLVVLRLNVPVNNFSVITGRSHRFLGK